MSETKIIEFPKRHSRSAKEDLAKGAQLNEQSTRKPAIKRNSLLSGVVHAIWVVTVLVWPVMKPLLSIYVFYLFSRMIYHWNTPGIPAGWAFTAGFVLLSLITYFVSVYKPKNT